MLRTLLSFAGRHGPLMLFTGVFVGLLAPNLAASARPLMGAAVFVLTLGAFLKVDKDALRLDLARPGRLLWLPLWIALGVPLLTWALLSVLPLPDGTKVGMLLCMLAPPVGSAAAIAAMLGLNPAMALSATLVVSLLCPFVLPPAALALGAIALHMDAGALMLRLALLVGGAATVAAALRRWAGGWVDSNPHTMTGVSVLGLIVGAMGAMHGMQTQWLQHGQDMALNLVLAFVLNAGFQWLGTVLFAPLGRTDALTAGLLSGNRNVSLVWVAAMPWLAGLPGAELYFAASVFPIFMLPLPLARLLAWQQQRNSSLHRFDRQRCEMPVAPVADCPQTAYAAPTTGTQRKP